MKCLAKTMVLALVSVAVLAAFQSTPAQAKKTLYLYNWSRYMKPGILKAFEKKYNVKVSQTFFGSNPEMFAKLQAGGDSQYDVVVPTNYYVPRLIGADLLQPLDKNLIPNLKNLLPTFKNPSYDPGNKYTAAYQWGYTGIAYNAKDLPDAPKSWSIIFGPKVNSQYPFTMITTPQIVLGAACSYIGLKYTCVGPDKWKKAAKLIIRTKKRPNFSGFTKGTPTLRRLARGAVSAGLVYNGDYVFFKHKNPEAYKNIKLVIPKEGSELWVDSMAIPKHAPHPKLANKFINFILNAKIGAELSNYNFYTSPNKASQPYLNKALTKPPIMPTKENMKKLHYIPALKGKNLKYVSQLWTEIKSR